VASWRSKNKGVTVEFIPLNSESGRIFDPPVPTSKVIPEWYKRQKSQVYEDDLAIDPVTGNSARTIKACMPVFDMLSSGYSILLPADIYIKDNPGSSSPEMSWSTDQIKPIDLHDPIQFNEFKLPGEYYESGIKLNNPWIIKTPPGYSCLFFTPPLRDDLPYYSIPGIVDTDKHFNPINFPVFFKRGWSGTLEMNTPIIQFIPFKREDWSHRVLTENNLDSEVEWQKAKRKLTNRYKTFSRTPKVWR
jgi:hypothetical protein